MSYLEILLEKKTILSPWSKRLSNFAKGEKIPSRAFPLGFHKRGGEKKKGKVHALRFWSMRWPQKKNGLIASYTTPEKIQEKTG